MSSADINHINFETLAKDLKFLYLFSILYKLSCLASSSFGHSSCIGRILYFKLNRIDAKSPNLELFSERTSST